MGSTPYIEPEDWKEFVQMCESEEAVIESERYKLLREQYKHEHCMGPTGYEGIQAQWDEEDRKLASLGIANPYEEFREDRTRSWLRVRSKLVISEGATHIKWKTEDTERLSKEIQGKQAHVESSGVTWTRENDVLTQCLGPEQPGHVRSVSSYNGWKEAWPGHLGMYRKRRKISSADLQTIKDELRAEVTQDILSMLASQGLQIVPLSRNTSPAPGRRSSCASAF